MTKLLIGCVIGFLIAILIGYAIMPEQDNEDA
jgi:hypothetical protein